MVPKCPRGHLIAIVCERTYDLLHSPGMTTMFGNPGSNNIMLPRHSLRVTDLL